MNTSLRRLALVPLLAGCGPAPEPVTPPPPVATAAPTAPKASCATLDECREAAQAATQAGDKDKALAMDRAGCELGSGEACLSLALAASSEPPKSLELAQRACKLSLAKGCVLAGDLLVKANRLGEAVDAFAKACTDEHVPTPIRSIVCGGATRGAYQIKDFDRALAIGAKACEGEITGGCDALGVMYGNGEGVAKDLAKASALFDKGCKAGDKEACSHKDAVAAMNDPLAVEGANLKMGSITVEGFAMSDMACKLKGGGLEMLVAGPVLAAVIGKKKAALDACAPKGADVGVRWTTAGRKVVDVTARADDPKVAACVERAVRTSLATFEATCRASFHIGK